MKHTTDQQRLNRYLATAAAVLGGASAQAQYLYTDIDDTTVVNGIFELDLDGDTIVDFTIEHILAGGQQGNVNAVLLHPGDSLEGNLAMGSAANGFNYVERVAPGTVLDPSQTFNGIGGNLEIGYMAFEIDGVAYPNSNWAGPVTDGYLGLRIVKNDSVCYGWLRMDVADSSKSITIKDWSFNPVKDSSHTVAFELLDVMETVLSQLRISNAAGQLEVYTGRPVALEVWDATGRLLARREEGSLHRFETATWASGMHILHLEGENWYHNVKVWIP